MTPIRALAIMAAASLTALVACGSASTVHGLPPVLSSAWPAPGPSPSWQWAVTTPEDVRVCTDPETGDQVTSREVPDTTSADGPQVPVWQRHCSKDQRPGSNGGYADGTQ